MLGHGRLTVVVFCCLHNLVSEYLCDELRHVADISFKATTEIVINICADCTANAAVYCWS